jgi:preprotein translocase subunit SecG
MRFYASGSGSKQAVKSEPTHRPAKLMSSRRKHRLARRLIVILIFAVAFIIFCCFLHFLTAERSNTPDSGAVSSPVTFSLV